MVDAMCGLNNLKGFKCVISLTQTATNMTKLATENREVQIFGGFRKRLHVGDQASIFVNQTQVEAM